MGMLDGMSFGSGQKTPIDVLNSLLDPENIAVKTDLNIGQVKVLVQLKWYELLKDPKNAGKEPLEVLNEVLEYFMLLMCSIGRRSRIEITDAVKELKREMYEELTLLQGLGGAKR